MPEALLITEYFPPVVGGAARWFDVVVKNAQTLRWTVLTQPVPGAPAEEEYHGHRVLRPAWWSVPPSFLKFRTVMAYWRLRRLLDRLCSASSFEVIHAMPAYGAAYIARAVCRERNIPLVTHVFGEEFGMQGRSAYRRKVMTQVLASSSAVVAISTATREQAVRLGADPRRTPILIAADLSRLAPLPQAAARAEFGFAAGPLLLTVSRIVERKGHDRVIESLPSLLRRHPELVYAIVGEGPDRERLESLARSLGVERSVRFLGLVPEEKLAALYSAADIFVMPNRTLPSGEIEGFGLVFVEAAACGVPSIGGRSGGSTSAILDGEGGLLVDPNDRAALEAAIDGLLDDPARRRKMGERARAWVSEEFDAARVIRRLEEVHRGDRR